MADACAFMRMYTCVRSPWPPCAQVDILVATLGPLQLLPAVERAKYLESRRGTKRDKKQKGKPKPNQEPQSLQMHGSMGSTVEADLCADKFLPPLALQALLPALASLYTRVWNTKRRVGRMACMKQAGRRRVGGREGGREQEGRWHGMMALLPVPCVTISAALPRA